MPKMGASHMTKRLAIIYATSPNLNNTETLIVASKESVALIVQACELDTTRLAIVDSGCSSDTQPIDLAFRQLPLKVCKLIKSIASETAADPVACSKGATVQFGPWDVPLDVCLSPSSPSLISVGQCVCKLAFLSSPPPTSGI